jgi:hypothetical protein
MAYSTQTQLQNNVKLIEATFSDATEKTNFATERIVLADTIVKAECQAFINFATIPNDSTTPMINLLSQYKSAELALRRLVGVNRQKSANDDISEWERLYKELKQNIAAGKMPVYLADGSTNVLGGVATFDNTARVNTKPQFGYDRYGRWIDNEDLTDVRGDVDDSTQVEDGSYID